MEEEIDLHSFSVKEWLHDRWNPSFWGWALCENETHEAIMLRVPDFYIVQNRKAYTSEENKYFNVIRFPSECKYCNKPHGITITFDFNKMNAMVWDKGTNYFESREDKIRESLSKFPKYFYLLELLEMQKQNPHLVSDICGDVYELWVW